MSQKFLTIESKEGKVLKVDARVENMIVLIKDMLEDNKNYDEKIPLDKISYEILKLIFEYCEKADY